MLRTLFIKVEINYVEEVNNDFSNVFEIIFTIRTLLLRIQLNYVEEVNNIFDRKYYFFNRINCIVKNFIYKNTDELCSGS